MQIVAAGHVTDVEQMQAVGNMIGCLQNADDRVSDPIPIRGFEAWPYNLGTGTTTQVVASEQNAASECHAPQRRAAALAVEEPSISNLSVRQDEAASGDGGEQAGGYLVDAGLPTSVTCGMPPEAADTDAVLVG